MLIGLIICIAMAVTFLYLYIAVVQDNAGIKKDNEWLRRQQEDGRHLHTPPAIISLLFLLASCAPKSSVPADYDQPWNVPTVSHKAMGYQYGFFGAIGCYDRDFDEDTLVYPPIPWLIHRSVYALCPEDSCFAEYLTLALRCPEVKSLQKWLSDKVYDFVDNSPIPYVGAGCQIRKKDCETTEATLEYYMDQLQAAQSSWTCPKSDDLPGINDQTGFLIADCWRVGAYYTFYEASWYDMLLSCGNHIKESYITVDSRTGLELKLEDFVLESKYGELYKKVKFYLKNEHGERWVDQLLEPEVYDESLLALANGCALIREGFIIYYYPYNIGCGADGEYTAVIPYAELAGLLKPGIARQVHAGC